MVRRDRRPYSLDRMLAYGAKNEAYVMGYAELDGSPHGQPEPDPLFDLLTEQLLPRLSDKHRAVLEALFWEQVGVRAYARRIGVDDKTVRNWRNRALNQLRAMLMEELRAHADAA